MGYGSVSKTIGESQIGFLSEDKWICEEHAFFELPIIYSAYAASPIVRVLRANKSDFLQSISSDLLR